MNHDISRDPVKALILKQDYEDIHQERRMPTLPMAQKANQTINAFLDALRSTHRDLLDLLDPINSYYCYLQTVAYKLAHYYGFCLADQLLPYLDPAYFSDPVHTSVYSMMLSRHLGLDISKLK